jgi:hypothetical protein
MGGGEPEDGEGFRDVLFEPGGELRSGLLVTGGDVAKATLGLCRLVRVEDSAEVAGDLRPHGDLRHVGHGILHEMELAALPGQPGEDCLPGSLESGMVVADDDLDAPHAAIDEALEEGAPMRLGLGELHTAAEDAPLSVRSDTDCREQGAGHDRTVMADFFVAGIEDEVVDLTDRPVPPGSELLVEFCRRPADLRGGDVQATEFLDDGRHLPGADALDVHLGYGQGHRPLAADASLERARVEGPSVLVPVATGLRDPQVDLADASLESLRLESVGVALTVASSLMRLGLEHLLSLDLHRIVSLTLNGTTSAFSATTLQAGRLNVAPAASSTFALGTINRSAGILNLQPGTGVITVDPATAGSVAGTIIGPWAVTGTGANLTDAAHTSGTIGGYTASGTAANALNLASFNSTSNQPRRHDRRRRDAPGRPGWHCYLHRWLGEQRWLKRGDDRPGAWGGVERVTPAASATGTVGFSGLR